MNLNRYFYCIYFFFLFMFLAFESSAQSFSGDVTDAITGEPVGGAIISFREKRRQIFVQLDGRFSIKNLTPGPLTFEVTSLNYVSFSSSILIESGKDFRLAIKLIPLSKELEAVYLTGSNTGTDRNIRLLEKNSNQLVNIVSAKNMQLLPDITVANVLQRVSGVTIEKSGSGEARYPIIRGMEKRYINTLVNGIKIPSPDNKNRFIPLDIFPSEVLERLEVSKSLTPSMEGDAIGGTINLVMKDAPASKIIQTNIALGFNNGITAEGYNSFDRSTMNKKSPYENMGANYTAVPTDFSVAHLNYKNEKSELNKTLGLTMGNRFGEKKQFGIIVAASFQDIYRGTTSNFFQPNSQPGLNNIPLFSDLQLRKYSVESQRIGLNAKFDYQINPKNKLSFSNSFVRLNDYQTRIIFDTVALNSLVNNLQRSTYQYQSIDNNTLQGLHQLTSSFKVDWSLLYSKATNHLPDQSQFTHQYAIVSTSLTQDKLQSMTRLWSHNSDADISGILNGTKNIKWGRDVLELKAGVLTRSKSRDNFFINYNLSPVLNQVFTTINAATYLFNPASDGRPPLNGNNYTFHEYVNAGFIQSKLKAGERLEFLGGIRIESTRQHYETLLSKDVDAKSGTITYTDVLPSFQAKWLLTGNQNLRLSYYRALARPGFSEMIPDGADGEFFKEIGAPQTLKHTIADNYDLRYELYTSTADQLLLGVFYKNIQDPIEISAVKPLNVNSLYLQPVNIGNARNYGFEAVITKYFGRFGVAANYTYTKSSITNDSLIYSSRNSAGVIVSNRVSETRPLQGQSDHFGNISFLYKNPKIGLDIQTALVYTGARINFISPYFGLNYWQSPITQLDISFEKRLVKKFTVYGKINNLTNAPFELSLHQSYNNYIKTSGSRALALQTDPANRIIIQKDFYKTSFLFGLRYKF